MNRLPKRLRALLRRRQLDRDLEEELRFHLDMAAEHVGAHNARRGFGSPTLIKETCRELWTFANLEAWWRDICYGLRMLVKNPGFTLVAVTALALGIGADTAMYTIVDGALSWNLGFDDRDRMVILKPVDAAHGQLFASSYPDFRDFRAELKSLSGLAAYQFGPVNLSDGSALPERYYNVEMSANGFSVEGYKPVLGRDFVAADELPGAPPIVILGYHVWRDRYNLDPAIIGKTVRIDEVSRVIAGVMPPGRRAPEETDLWTPLTGNASREKRDSRSLMVFGRLADGVSIATARAEAAALAKRLADQYPDTNKGLSADIRPLMELTGVYLMRPIFLAMLVAVAFVLLIACADVANMLLARGAGRSREISIRFAIGAGRVPILRQLLLESVVLAVAGGLFGYLVALAGLRWFDSGISSIPKPVWLHLSLDAAALRYLTAISLGTGILFGFAPALRLAKTDINSALKDGGVGVVGSKFGMRLSNLLVAAQMALCVVLLVAAGLLIRSVVNLYGTPLGINASGVLTMQLNLPEAKYREPEKEIAFHDLLKKRLESLPGVEGVSLASQLPLGSWIPSSFEIEGVGSDSPEPPETGAIITGAGYFGVMQVQPRHGRLFADTDRSSSVPVAIVNESFAAKFWPGQEALGKRLRFIEDHSPKEWLTVVGVAPDILQNFRQPLEHDPLIYVPYSQKPERQVFLAARTAVAPGTLAQAFRREVHGVDENLPVYDVRSLEDRIAENRLTPRLFGAICSVFAGIATVLAAIGLYAVVAHAVRQRSEEIGLRIALGASARDVARLVFVQGIKPLAPGLSIGLVLAFATTRALRIALVGVSSVDPLTFVSVILVLLLAAVLGCIVPARRAMRVDPVTALRGN